MTVFVHGVFRHYKDIDRTSGRQLSVSMRHFMHDFIKSNLVPTPHLQGGKGSGTH